MSSDLSPQESYRGTDNSPRQMISRSPAVAVGNFKDGLISIWAGFALNLFGFYPLIVFFVTLDDPSFLKTFTAWGFVALPLLIGVTVGAFGIKERGYQKTGFRIFGIASLLFGAICLILPALASLLFVTGNGH